LKTRPFYQSKYRFTTGVFIHYSFFKVIFYFLPGSGCSYVFDCSFIRFMLNTLLCRNTYTTILLHYSGMYPEYRVSGRDCKWDFVLKSLYISPCKGRPIVQIRDRCWAPINNKRFEHGIPDQVGNDGKRLFYKRDADSPNLVTGSYMDSGLRRNDNFKIGEEKAGHTAPRPTFVGMDKYTDSLPSAQNNR
jgi:hypothetical protein